MPFQHTVYKTAVFGHKQQQMLHLRLAVQPQHMSSRGSAITLRLPIYYRDFALSHLPGLVHAVFGTLHNKPTLSPCTILSTTNRHSRHAQNTNSVFSILLSFRVFLRNTQTGKRFLSKKKATMIRNSESWDFRVLYVISKVLLSLYVGFCDRMYHPPALSTTQPRPTTRVLRQAPTSLFVERRDARVS